MTYKKPIVEIQLDDYTFQGPLMMLAVCNSSTFASGLIIQPDAKVDDGILHLCLIGDVTMWDYVSNIFKLKSGVKIIHPSISYHSTTKVSIHIKSGNALIEADGELIESGDSSFSVYKKQLKLLVV